MWVELVAVVLILGLLVWLIVAVTMKKRTSQMARTLQKIRNTDGPRADISDIVDLVLVIAIPKRKEYITQALKTYGLHPGSYQFVDTVMKDDLEANNVPWHMTSGEVACYKSHMRAVQQLVDSGASTGLIFEDDLKQCPDYDLFQRRLGELKRELQWLIEGWDIIYFGRCNDTCMMNKQVSEQLVKNTSPICLHAYMLSRRGAQKLVKYVSQEPGVPIDVVFMKLILTGKMRSLSVSPSLFYQNKDIGTTVGNPRELRECLMDNHDWYKEQSKRVHPTSLILPI